MLPTRPSVRPLIALMLCLSVGLVASLSAQPIARSVSTTIWGAPSTLSTGTGNAAGQRVAVGEDGTVAVAWLQPVGGFNYVHVTVRPPNSAWRDTRALSGPTDRFDLAVDAEGTVDVMWVHIDSTSVAPDVVRHFTWFADDSTQTGVLSDPTFTSAAGSPSAAAGDTTTAFSWYGFDDNAVGPRVFVVTRTDGSFSLVGDQPASSGPAIGGLDARPALDVASDATITLAWEQEGGTIANRVVAVSRRPDGAWSTTKILSDPSVNAYDPEVTSNAEEALVTFLTYDGAESAIEVQSSLHAPVTRVWDDETTLTRTDWVPTKVAIGSGPDGTVTLAWHGVFGGTNTVYAATRNPAGSWGAEQRLSRAGETTSLAGVAADLDHTAVVMESADDQGRQLAFGRLREHGGPWQARRAISPPAHASHAGDIPVLPHVASSGPGPIATTWRWKGAQWNRSQVSLVGTVTVADRTRLALKAKPKRDRKAPYKFKLSGQVKGAFKATPEVCGGKVNIKLVAKGDTLARAKVKVNKRCGYHAKVKVPGSKVSSKVRKDKKTLKAKVKASFTGTKHLLRSAAKTKVRLG